MLPVRLSSFIKQDIQIRPSLLLVVPEAIRCMQCGVCSFNCPAGIDVRSYAWQGLPVDDSACLTCGECILRCPRRALHFEEA